MRASSIWILVFILSVTGLCSQPTAVPTYNCLGISWNEVGGGGISCTTEYKKSNDLEWNKAQDLWWDARSADELHGNEYRGSIVGLDPGTSYDVRLSLSNGTIETISVSTWLDVSDLPIAQTINVGSQSSGYTITNGGSPTGYILYDGTGSTITGGDEVGLTIDADYIILRGLTIKDVGPHGLELLSVNHVIIEDCDISIWGTESGGYQTEDDCGIWSNKCGLNSITIQNCDIHHPRFDTNNWDEFNPTVPDCSSNNCHPAGANAISFECQEDESIPSTGNYVIRNNRIYSDYEHMFNDGIGADNNFSYNGFPIRDSDIYGNKVSHVWDDALEIEGGNMNVRVWDNQLDSINIAFGLATTSIGPLYVFRNISKWGKAKPNRDWGWSMFKLGDSEGMWNQGAMFLYHNTIRQPDGHGVYDGLAPPTIRNVQNYITCRNNILDVIGNSISPDASVNMPNSTFDYDMCVGVVPSDSEANGILNETPNYTLGTDTLELNSYGIDAGQILWNFNDAKSAWPYSGNAPEMGAIESISLSSSAVTLPVRVNVGGVEYQSLAGNTFLADQKYAFNNSWGFTSIGNVENRPNVDILNTQDDDLYLTERWWDSEGVGAYVFNIPNGIYDLNLHFVEFNDAEIGFVEFDVKVENKLVLEGFDIRAEVAQQTALIKSVEGIEVSDGQFNLDFSPLLGSAGSKIMAIEIFDHITSTSENASLLDPLSVYPNPLIAGERLHVSLRSGEKITSVELYSISGQKMRSLNLNKSSSVINTAGITVGMYIISVKSNDHTYRKLLIIGK